MYQFKILQIFKMDEDIIKKMREKVIKENPEFKDVEPIVKEEVLEISETIKEKMKKMGKEITSLRSDISETNSEIKETKQGFEKKKIKTITFKRFAVAEDGAKIPIVLRLTVDEKGNILKESGN